MADIKSQKDRSKNMSAIKSRDTKPEIYFRKELFNRGYRYRIASPSIPGHPDLYLAKYNTAIFVHGCFWHRHAGCKYTYVPKSREDFWKNKFNNNVKRDEQVKRELREKNIRCLIVWECAINLAKKKTYSSDSLFDAVIAFINSDNKYLEIEPKVIQPV